MNDLSITGDPNITPKDDKEPYSNCSPLKERPDPVFNPYRDVLFNDWIYCRLADGDDLPIWTGRCLSCVN